MMTDEGRSFKDETNNGKYDKIVEKYIKRARTIRVFNHEMVSFSKRTFEMRVSSDHYFIVFDKNFKLLESQ